MKKKIVSLLLCVALVCAMAVPAFADWEIEPDLPMGHSPNRLNVYGNLGSPMQGRQLTLWTDNGSADQRFVVKQETTNGKKYMYLLSSQSTSYAINRSTQSVAGGQLAIMWLLSTGKNDSAFLFPSRPDPANMFRLANHTYEKNNKIHHESLAASGDYSGATVFFLNGSSSGTSTGGLASWLVSGTPTIG